MGGVNKMIKNKNNPLWLYIGMSNWDSIIRILKDGQMGLDMKWLKNMGDIMVYGRKMKIRTNTTIEDIERFIEMVDKDERCMYKQLHGMDK